MNGSWMYTRVSYIRGFTVFVVKFCSCLSLLIFIHVTGMSI